MIELVAFLIFCQAFGSAIGAFTAVWGELAYVHALQDGKITHAERAHLKVIGRGLRFGMSLLLFASLGLVVVAYLAQATPQPVLTASYWVLIIVAFLIIGFSWALSRQHISFALGSAVAFAGWWFLVYLTFGLLPLISFGATIAYLIVSTVLLGAILYGTRALILILKIVS